MNWKSFAKIFGITLLVLSFILLASSFFPLVRQWISSSYIEYDQPFIYAIIGGLLLILGILYSVTPKEKINGGLIISMTIALLTMLINLSYFGFVFSVATFGSEIGTLSLALMYAFGFFPASVIALVISIVFGFIGLSKK